MIFISEFIKRVERSKLFIIIKIENYIEEIEDIKSRYGIDSNVYKKCRKLVKKIGDINENR